VKQAQEFIAKMNRMGKDRTPFLFIVDFESNHPEIYSPAEAEREGIFFRMEGKPHQAQDSGEVEKSAFVKDPVSFQQYVRSFDVVKKHIHHGNSFLVNLTLPTPVRMNDDLKSLYPKAHAPFKLLYKDKFVVFSPEIFVKINEQGIISSYPMKGTIDASIENAAQIILSDEKETAEHVTIVDLIRNDLSSVAGDVYVKRYRYLDTIHTNFKTLLQVSSEICGVLPGRWNECLGDIFGKLLPAGSVSGAPKQKTLEIIRQAEGIERGWFTGVFGFFDGLRLSSAVMIRFIEKTTSGYQFRSGGGITGFSDPEKEYQEMIDKVYVPVF